MILHSRLSRFFVGLLSLLMHPRCIRSGKRSTKNLPNQECKITSISYVYCDSAIGQHLLENEECAKHFNDAQFSILATARSSFHLSVLEATYINSLTAYSLPSKRIRLFTPNFTLIFLLKQYFSTNQIAKMTNFNQS